MGGNHRQVRGERGGSSLGALASFDAAYKRWGKTFPLDVQALGSREFISLWRRYLVRKDKDDDVGPSRSTLNVWVRNHIRGKFDAWHVLDVFVLRDEVGACQEMRRRGKRSSGGG